MTKGSNFILVLLWGAVLAFAVYHGTELQKEFWDGAGSAPQQAAVAAYRAGMIVLCYVVGRCLSQSVKSISSIRYGE